MKIYKNSALSILLSATYGLLICNATADSISQQAYAVAIAGNPTAQQKSLGIKVSESGHFDSVYQEGTEPGVSTSANASTGAFVSGGEILSSSASASIGASIGVPDGLIGKIDISLSATATNSYGRRQDVLVSIPSIANAIANATFTLQQSSYIQLSGGNSTNNNFSVSISGPGNSQILSHSSSINGSSLPRLNKFLQAGTYQIQSQLTASVSPGQGENSQSENASIVLQINPVAATSAPITKIQLQSADTMSIDFTGILQESSDLNNWNDVTPQPRSPFLIVPTNGSKFFRARSTE